MALVANGERAHERKAKGEPHDHLRRAQLSRVGGLRRPHGDRAKLSQHRYAASRGKRTGGTDRGAAATEVCATARASIMASRMESGSTGWPTSTVSSRH